VKRKNIFAQRMILTKLHIYKFCIREVRFGRRQKLIIEFKTDILASVLLSCGLHSSYPIHASPCFHSNHKINELGLVQETNMKFLFNMRCSNLKVMANYMDSLDMRCPEYYDNTMSNSTHTFLCFALLCFGFSFGH